VDRSHVDDVAADVNQRLALVFVLAVVDDELVDEEGNERVAAQRVHVRSGDGEHLAQEGLKETVQSAAL